MQSLKKLLDDANANEADRRPKLAILRQYLELVKPKETGEEAVFVSDIMETWSIATQVNDDGVMSSVAVVLALMLRALSDSLELVSHGLGICQTLLQERQLKSLSRNLSAEKGKGFIISPTYRLLREAVCLDGGAYAKRIFRVRTFTFTSLGRNLEIGHIGDAPEDFSKASVRTNAVKFLLSCIKYLNADGKKELLLQKELMSHLTFMIKNDPPYMVSEILDSLKTHILMDTGIPREAKLRGFNTKMLMRFLALYSYNNPAAEAEESEAVIEKAHKFLVYACTSTSAGVLYPAKGLYPKESDEDSTTQAIQRSNGADGNLWGDKFRESVPVYNFVLSEFASKLRPWSSLKHNELLVEIFKAAPELIADYFFNNRSFTFEPKLSMTWIGYAAFLFNAMTIPLPPSFGDAALYASIPPPTFVLLDNVIPQPVNQKVMIRCLSPKSHLTSLFAMRILVVALEKLSGAIKMHSEGPRKDQANWVEAKRRLVDAFCQRIPDMKEIVRSYKAIPVENAIHRLMASRLLRLYYEVVPQVALAANFDVSSFFVDVLGSLHQGVLDADAQAYAVMELENLVSIASYSPGMRWFTKVEGLREGQSYSAFTALLRLLSDSDQNTSLDQLKRVLGDVATESQLVASGTKLTALLRALRCTIDIATPEQISSMWSFLDNSANRCASSPIKYLELLSTLTTPIDAFSLLNVCLFEQLPFVLDGADKLAKSITSRFLSFYFNAVYLSGEDKPALQALYKKVAEQLNSKKVDKMAPLGDTATIDILQSHYSDEDTTQPETPTSQPPSSMDMSEDKLRETLDVPFLSEEEDASALVKWAAKSVEDLVEDEWAARLIRLLSSPHTHIRKEALTNILKMAAKVDESSYEEKKQVWLLLSELAESSRPQVTAGRVPSVFISFSVHALDILKNPLHPLYPKINTYLTRSPVWPLEKLPMAHDILHGEPSEDDKYYTEVTWLLTHLLDGLRNPLDLGVFHKKRWFEKILALGSNPYLRVNLRTRILRILYRSTMIDGGSTTLITRFGVLSWLDGQRTSAASPEDAALYKALMKRMWDTCDQARVSTWSKGGVNKLVNSP